MNVAVVGTGYVGLVSGLCLVEKGHRVVCVDLDEEKVRRISAGNPPFFESGLPELLARGIERGFEVSMDLPSAVRASELTLICVGTPTSDGAIDLGQVLTCATQIGEALRGGRDRHEVVVKSTVLPGTTDEQVAPVLEQASGLRIGAELGIGVNPEFLTEGRAIHDFMNPDRIVIGGRDEQTHRALEALYAGFDPALLMRVSTRTAEAIKYASNAMLATQISFSNEIANLCEAVGDVDVVDVMEGVHRSYYLQPFLSGNETGRVLAPLASFLEAGCGFGGSCLPKDVAALVGQGRRLGSPLSVLDAVLETNRGRPYRLVDLLKRQLPDLSGRAVTVLGLAFKPGTDDVRESPAFPVIRRLLEDGAVVTAYDPVANDNAARILDHDRVNYASTLDEAVNGAEGLILVTSWEAFLGLPERIAHRDPAPVVVDGRRMLDPESVARYEGIGRSPTAGVSRTQPELGAVEPLRPPT